MSSAISPPNEPSLECLLFSTLSCVLEPPQNTDTVNSVKTAAVYKLFSVSLER